MWYPGLPKALNQGIYLYITRTPILRNIPYLRAFGSCEHRFLGLETIMGLYVDPLGKESTKSWAVLSLRVKFQF